MLDTATLYAYLSGRTVGHKGCVWSLNFFPSPEAAAPVHVLGPFGLKPHLCTSPHHSHDNDSGNLQIGILSLVFLQGEKLRLNFSLSFSFCHKTLEETINW